MFLGTYFPKLDEKGRLVLPARYREELAGGVVLTKGQERSVVLWTKAGFDLEAQRLSAVSRSDARRRAYLRVLFSGAFDQTPDRQGRITIPPALRAYAGLDRDIVVAGNGETLELWDAAAFEAYIAAQEDAYSDLSEEVLPA